MIEPFIHKSAEIREGCIIGEGTIIGPFVRLERGVKIGKNCTIQPFSILGVYCIVEDNVFIGPHFSMADCKKVPQGEHGLSPNKEHHDAFPIKIKKGAILGARCTIAPGVTIGENARIDMCCQIYSDVPAGTFIKSGSIYRV